MTSGTYTKQMTQEAFDAINDNACVIKERFLDTCSIEELVNALTKRSDKVEEIQARSTFDFTIDTYYGSCTRSGPATILVVESSLPHEGICKDCSINKKCKTFSKERAEMFGCGLKKVDGDDS